MMGIGKIRKGKRILAVSSGGGHWTELLRIRPALKGHEQVYATVRKEYGSEVEGCRFFVINDATAWNWIKLSKLGLRVFWLVVKLRPDVVVSTGAAPGYFAIVFGKIMGARTIWLDSIANVDELSKAGRMAGRFADLWLTQWPELAQKEGPEYCGRVL